MSGNRRKGVKHTHTVYTNKQMFGGGNAGEPVPQPKRSRSSTSSSSSSSSSSGLSSRPPSSSGTPATPATRAESVTPGTRTGPAVRPSVRPEERRVGLKKRDDVDDKTCVCSNGDPRHCYFVIQPLKGSCRKCNNTATRKELGKDGPPLYKRAHDEGCSHGLFKPGMTHSDIQHIKLAKTLQSQSSKSGS